MLFVGRAKHMLINCKKQTWNWKLWREVTNFLVSGAARIEIYLWYNLVVRRLWLCLLCYGVSDWTRKEVSVHQRFSQPPWSSSVRLSVCNTGPSKTHQHSPYSSLYFLAISSPVSGTQTERLCLIIIIVRVEPRTFMELSLALITLHYGNWILLYKFTRLVNWASRPHGNNSFNLGRKENSDPKSLLKGKLHLGGTFVGQAIISWAFCNVNRPQKGNNKDKSRKRKEHILSL